MGLFSVLFGQSVSVNEFKRIRRHYDSLLKRRDEEIAELKKEHALLLKNALVQATKRNEMGEHAKRLIEINRDLNRKRGMNG
jgi:hypothetical protein